MKLLIVALSQTFRKLPIPVSIHYILSLSATVPDVALPADERTMASTTVSRGAVNITHSSTEPSFSTTVKFPDLNDSSENMEDVKI